MFVLFLAVLAHNVKSNDIVEIGLTDEYGMPIDDGNVVNILKQFKNCSHFFIEIDAKFRQTDINTIAEVTLPILRLSFLFNCLDFTYLRFLFQSLRNYLKANEGEFILKEQEKLRCLKKKTKNKLIEKLVAYIFTNYTMYPATDDIVLVSNAAVQIFDKLKDHQGGIVSVIFSNYQI